MPTISERMPEDVRQAKASQYRDWFLKGWIGEATYETSLFILGLRGQDLRAEISLARMEKGQKP